MTDDVTRYDIEETARNPPLIVYDTPGFGDTRGQAQDQKIFGIISKIFKEVLDEIHSICFVMRCNTTRLTAIEEYVMSNTTAIFGADVSPAVTMLTTFFDGGEIQAKDALKISKSFEPVRNHFDRH